MDSWWLERWASSQSHVRRTVYSAHLRAEKSSHQWWGCLVMKISQVSMEGTDDGATPQVTITTQFVMP
jgi:hypothetical protein